MNVIVLNKSKAQRLSYTDYSYDKVIISIRTPDDEKAEFDSNMYFPNLLCYRKTLNAFKCK